MSTAWSLSLRHGCSFPFAPIDERSCRWVRFYIHFAGEWAASRFLTDSHKWKIKTFSRSYCSSWHNWLFYIGKAQTLVHQFYIYADVWNSVSSSDGSQQVGVWKFFLRELRLGNWCYARLLLGWWNFRSVVKKCHHLENSFLFPGPSILKNRAILFFIFIILNLFLSPLSTISPTHFCFIPFFVFGVFPA